MLLWGHSMHLANILIALNEVWDGIAVVEKIDVIEGRAGMAIIDVGIGIEDRAHIRLEYERSFLDVFIKRKGEYVYLGHLVKLPEREFFKDCEMRNLLPVLKAAAKYLEEHKDDL